MDQKGSIFGRLVQGIDTFCCAFYAHKNGVFTVELFVEPSSGKPTSSTWTSTAKSNFNADSNKREDKAKSKVVFDEMGDGKEKQDVPEKENKTATSKSGMAGDTHDSLQV